MTNFRFYGTGCLPRHVYEANTLACLERGFHPVEAEAPHGRPLAVCGGGLTLRGHLEELKAWPGDVWGVNATAPWLVQQGIPATFFSVDPQYTPPEMIGDAPAALVSSSSDESVFDHMGERPVRVFHTAPLFDDGIKGGPTSATFAPRLALHLGYTEVHFFGCDAMVSPYASHVYGSGFYNDLITVSVGGRHFSTRPEFLMQTEFLAQIIAAFPVVYVNRSGDFVQAMVESGGEHEIVWMAPPLAAKVGFDNKDAA